MRRTVLSFALMLAGVMMVIVSLGLGSAPAASAMPLLQPSPRPTLAPVVDEGSERKPTAVVATARVTGTVIDLTTGAPVPGVAVDVSGDVVTTDRNGNYERVNMVSGFYTLTLRPTAAQGTAAQGAMQIAVGQGDTVVAHLFLYSQQATATAQSVPTTQPTPVFIEPTPTTEVVALAAAAPRSGPRLPARLPETAVGSASNNRLWLALGFATIALGSLLLMLPLGRKTRRTSDSAMLQRLLKDETPAEKRSRG